MNAIEPFVVLLDRSGRAAWVSRGESGVPAVSLLGTSIWDWTVAEDRRLAQRCFADCLLNRAPQDFFVTVDALGTHVRQHVVLEHTGGETRPVAVKSTAVHPRIESLTPRQRQILRSLGLGLSRKRIARELGLSAATIDGHCAAASERLGISGAELAVFAILQGCNL